MAIRYLPLALMLTLPLAPTVVLAQAALPGFENPLTDPGADRRKAEDLRRIDEFQKIDANSDGILQPNEIAAFRTRVFEAMDANGDGLVELGEFRLRRIDLPASAKGGAFAILDRNSDGVLNLDEYIDVPGTQAADIDGDGAMSIWEFRTRD